MPKFTFIDIANWRKFEAVRESGEFNMFDTRARISAGLTYEQYIFCMDKYTELRKEAIEFDEAELPEIGD